MSSKGDRSWVCKSRKNRRPGRTAAWLTGGGSRGDVMKCAEAKSMFSPYLDGAVTGTQMHSLGLHLEQCSDCNREYALLRHSQELLATIRRQKAPADLQLKLRLPSPARGA